MVILYKNPSGTVRTNHSNHNAMARKSSISFAKPTALSYTESMKLEQGQIWKKGDKWILITMWARLDIEYKEMTDLETREGTHHEASKKEFCRLIKGAELYTPEPEEKSEDAPEIK